MIPKECRRLAEVDFPIAEVSRQASREKSIRHGHPSTLHPWWARRPLASCRAILLCLLLPDPEDPACPSEFKEKARRALPKTLAEVGPTDADLRRALIEFVGMSADWDKSGDPGCLNAARSLIRAAHGSEAPLVVDPFAGGGSIPLEALRLGCDAFASDLNPVAGLILRVLLEDIPQGGSPLVEELDHVGMLLSERAGRAAEHLYPPDPDGSRPAAYLWARTVRCESPNCGVEIPLVRSFWVSKKVTGKRDRRMALRPVVLRDSSGAPTIGFELFEPRADSDLTKGTVARAKATCLACGATLPPDRVRAQLRQAAGGADSRFDRAGERTGGARLLAVVLRGPSGELRYRLPVERDYASVRSAQVELAKLEREDNQGKCSVIPAEETPRGGGTGAGRAFSLHTYGMLRWGDLFTARQKLVMTHLIRASNSLDVEGAVQELLALAASRFAHDYSALAKWMTRETIAPSFSLNAISMVWDFCEANPFDDSSWSFNGGIGWISEVVQALVTPPVLKKGGQVQLADAAASPLPDRSAQVWFTDPPYYDSVPYSDLSDFFFVWLRRALPNHPLLQDPWNRSNPLTPKDREAVQDDARLVDGVPKDKAFFESVMARAFAEGRRVVADDGIACIIFAHKTTEGWEALLNGLVSGGWTITSSWPLATERPGRQRSQDSAALSTSVHLICRPRPLTAPVGEWSSVVQELPTSVRAWMGRLEGEKIRGADLVFACIGPAMEVYSRYSKVVDAQDRQIPLGGDPTASEPHLQGYLAKVWEIVGRLALEQVLGSVSRGATSLEEDARLTALFLWTLQSSGNGATESSPPEDSVASERETDEETATANGAKGGYALIHDVARRFAQPLGIHLDVWEGRLIETDKGVVRLLTLEERARQLFGKEDVATFASSWDEGVRKGGHQTTLFPDEVMVAPPTPEKLGRRSPKVLVKDSPDGHPAGIRRATTLDRLHAAMLLQKAGASAALKTFLEEERRRGPELERLATALSALYPQGSEERRLVEALSLAFPKK